jgi:hypothetical protein
VTLPTPSTSRPIPRGLSLADHERLALQLRHLVRDLTTLRTTVKAGLGDGGEPYAAAEEAVMAARRLSLSLAEALDAAGGDAEPRRELRTLYLTAGAEVPGRSHGSSLAGESSLVPLNGKRPLGREG